MPTIEDIPPSSQLEVASDSATASQYSLPVNEPIPSRARIAFISGHMDLTPQQLSQYYLARLDDALAQGHHFVIGDAKGVDTSPPRAE